MSAITLNGATSGQVTLQPPAVAGTTTLTLPTSNGTVINTAGGQTISGTTTLGTMSATNAQVTQGLASAAYLSPFDSGYRNRIINGSMGIAQRGTSFSSPASGSYTVDRWWLYATGTTVASVAQVAGPTGYRYATQITGAAGNTQTALVQRIESYNCSDLSGQTITIQANISVSSAQTINWNLQYPSAQDNWSSTTAFASGTWSATTTATTFTATITGLPSNVTNGMQLQFAPQNGGAFTSGTITITGVQLELGSVATPFEVRSVGTELALCQRYYYNMQAQSIYALFGSGFNNSTSQASVIVNIPVPMRVTPTCSTSSVSNFYIVASGGTFSLVSINPAHYTPTTVRFDCNTSGTPLTFGMNCTLSASGTDRKSTRLNSSH